MYQAYEKLRDDRGLTDYRVAMETNIPKSTFSEWKSGRSKPKLEKLIKLADFFDVPITTFIQKES